MMMGVLAVSLLVSSALANKSDALDELYEGPDHVKIDLMRGSSRARIFVQAELPDGELGLFMVDTGADISVLQQDIAEDLGLDIQENWGIVQGLSGQASMHRAVLPTLGLGEATVKDIEVAVGVPGVSERHEFMPLAGILGNNVWSHFVMELDYPADLMVLHRPGKKRVRGGDLLLFEGGHVLSPITITTDADPPHSDGIVIQVDTGAGNLLLAGASGRPFEQDYTEGLEPVWGIGASETIPPYVFQRVTRRIPMQRVELGGKKVDVDFEARWMNFDTMNPVGPAGMRGLAGHELMMNHRVWFDYGNHVFKLAKSWRKKRRVNGHEVLLEQDLERYGEDDVSRYLYRAQLNAGLGNYDGTTELLNQYLEPHPDDGEARVLLARLQRGLGNLDASWVAIEPLGAEALIEEDELVATVNGLLFEDRTDRAEELAREAIAVRPDDDSGYVALADTLLYKRAYEEAHRALLEAVARVGYPDAYLLRRARVALARGDTYGSMAHVRKLIQLYPSMGYNLWFYALSIDGPAEADTFRADMAEAMARLHPRGRPLDFMVAAHAALGDEELAVDLMQQGIERDCPGDIAPAAHDNCLAWYWSLAGENQQESLDLIERALESEGDRSDFLDTKAMVHLARGELDQAYDAALAAARMSPQDIYMLWQAERIGQMAERAE